MLCRVKRSCGIDNIGEGQKMKKVWQSCGKAVDGVRIEMGVV